MDSLQKFAHSPYQSDSAAFTEDIPDVDRKVAEELSALWGKYRNNCKYIESPYPHHEILSQFTKCIQPAFEKHGWQGIKSLYLDWPEDNKETHWFSTLCHFIFSNPGASELPDVLARIIETTSPHQTPQAIYRSVLAKLLESRGYVSCEHFIAFMDWMVQWNVFKDHPCPELLKEVPARQRLTRPDLPWFSESVQKTNQTLCCDEGCWGGRNESLKKRYLPHTVHAHHAGMLAFLNHAPESYLLPLLVHRLNDPGAEPVKEILFASRQHPLSVTWSEPRPWNILLTVLKRIMPEPTSDFLKRLQQFDSPVPFKDLSKQFFQSLEGAKKIVFGRTVGFLKQQGNIYLKFQGGNESDENFLKQASRYQFACKHGKEMELNTDFAKVIGVLRVSDLQETLVHLSLSRKEQATVCIKSAQKNLLSTCEEIFGENSDPYWSVMMNGSVYHETSFVDESLNGPVLTIPERKALVSHIIENGHHPRLAMILETPKGCQNEKYVYQAETPDQVLQDLTAFAHDF